MSQWIITTGITRYWRVTLVTSALFLVAAMGTYVSGQYRIGRLEALIDRYSLPVTDFASANSRARQGTMEADLLEGCKQAQIGTWLQTTDALKFKDPVSGNRISVELEPGRDYIDINGRDISSCVTDEIENRQYDIGSMTNTWALCLLMTGLIIGAVAFVGRRQSHRI